MKFQVGDIVRIKEAIIKPDMSFNYFGDLVINSLGKIDVIRADLSLKNNEYNAYLNRYYIPTNNLILLRRSYNEISGG